MFTHEKTGEGEEKVSIKQGKLIDAVKDDISNPDLPLFILPDSITIEYADGQKIEYSRLSLKRKGNMTMTEEISPFSLTIYYKEVE